MFIRGGNLRLCPSQVASQQSIDDIVTMWSKEDRDDGLEDSIGEGSRSNPMRLDVN